MNPLEPDQQALKTEIADLEQRLQNARQRLNPPHAANGSTPPIPNPPLPVPDPTAVSTLHTLLLLADSALPLGSFAFSSGLESFLAHHPATSVNGSSKPQFQSQSQPQSSLLSTFLPLSLSTLASTSLPYVLAAYREPDRLLELDNDFDASTPCTVARRASTTQGRALLAVWERSFRGHYSGEHITDSTTATASPFPTSPEGQREENDNDNTALKALKTYQSHLHLHPTSLSPSPFTPTPCTHYAPLYGLLCHLLRLPAHTTAYLFLFSHARTVVSAAVRASVLGPYQAQAVLAGAELRERIEGLVWEWEGRGTEEAGQTVPVVDLWVGRHEKLYSRIFNS
ncbi:hypothetical protein K402DRAFT_394261 [Aulographum hederae CBS 113979]|uniref:Urease accessory protein UreF n=1 Tax=Aulographum hederae CBS 113979 TaxID=1176131 RepID=A0A6G1GYH5_9PEZI|nr:hypothetical protein K402DRAFT_394261 [Aulographum hederae CBS 113979]